MICIMDFLYSALASTSVRFKSAREKVHRAAKKFCPGHAGVGKAFPTVADTTLKRSK